MPDWVFRIVGLADTLSVVDEERPDYAPSEDCTTEHRKGRVETDEHTRTDEGRSDFDVPAPVFNVERPISVPRPYVEPGMLDKNTWLPG